MGDKSRVIFAKAGTQLLNQRQELGSCLRGNDEAEFKNAATRLAGLTGAIFGWRPDEFWTATPAELATIFEALSPPAFAPPTSADVTRLQELFPDG